MNRKRLGNRLVSCLLLLILIASLGFLFYLFTHRERLSDSRSDDQRETGSSFSLPEISAPVFDPDELPTIALETEDGSLPSFTPLPPPEEGMIGYSITDNAYVSAQCTVMNLPTAPEFRSAAKIRVRGNTSAAFTPPDGKLPYKLILEEPADLFGLDRSDRKFTLLAGAGTDLRSYLGFRIGELCGLSWTPACRYVNLVINGDLKGVYLLVESLTESAMHEHVDSDGLFFEGDAYWWKSDVYFHSQRLSQGLGYTVKFPKLSGSDDPVFQELQNYMSELEMQFFTGTSLSSIDEDSFAAWIIARDLLGSGDPAGSNIYYYFRHFSGDGPVSQLAMGPLWDFDAAFANFCSWSEQHNSPSLYFAPLFRDPQFCQCYLDKWKELSPVLLPALREDLTLLLETQGDAIDAARRSDAQRWGGEYHPLAEEIAQRLDWLEKQIAWIDGELSLADEIGDACFDPLSIKLSEKGRTLELALRDASYSRVIFYVWSEASGQGDLTVCRARLSSGQWEYTLHFSYYREKGVYYVHAYASSGDGLELARGNWFYRE